MKTTKGTRVAALLLALLLLANSRVVLQTEATFFLIGGACVVGLEAAEEVLRGQLGNLQEPIELVQNLCRFIQRYSLPGIVLNDVLPQVRRLIELTAPGAIDLVPGTPPFEEFQLIVRRLAQVSVQVTG